MNKMTNKEWVEYKADFWGYLVLPGILVIMLWGAWELYHAVQPAFEAVKVCRDEFGQEVDCQATSAVL